MFLIPGAHDHGGAVRSRAPCPTSRRCSTSRRRSSRYYLLRPVARRRRSPGYGATEFGGLAARCSPVTRCPALRFLFLVVLAAARGFRLRRPGEPRGARVPTGMPDWRGSWHPQVAEVVLSTGSALLEPHRRLIAVLFCDLRGFTRFASSAEPEDTVEVLQQLLRGGRGAHPGDGATVGGFAGDGIMAYFNDPVPHDDAAGAAVRSRRAAARCPRPRRSTGGTTSASS